MRISFGGAVTQIDVFKKNLFKLKHLIQKGFKIYVFDGTDLCKWNGGRVNTQIFLTEEILDFYNSNGIGVNLTFTNNIIDVSDKTGNKLLKMISKNPLNGVIVANKLLRDYIKMVYPNMEITYSFTTDVSKTEEYLELEDDYDYIVPKIDLFFDENFYSVVDLPKYELWVDEQCIGCEKIAYHYNIISEINRKYDIPYVMKGAEYCKAWNDCILQDYNHCNNKDLNYFNKETIDKLLKIGYSNFKIPGRDFQHDRFDDIIGQTYNFFKGIK